MGSHSFCKTVTENLSVKYRKKNKIERIKEILGWCKSSCGFYIVEIYHLMLEYILNKCAHVYIILLCISRFIKHMADDLLLAVYFIFILDYGNDVRQKANLSDFLI